LETRHASLANVYQEKHSHLLPRGGDLAKEHIEQEREHSARSRRPDMGNPENKTKTALAQVYLE